MISLASGTIGRVLSSLGPEEAPGLLALRHALIQRRPGLWADDPRRPRGVLLVREGDDRLEAFGAGRPHPAIAWLAARGRPITLLAPQSWGDVAHREVGRVHRAEVQTWFHPGPFRPADRGPAIAVHRLTPVDALAFAEAAPSWALRGWGTFSVLIERGVGFGVRHGKGFAALAWIFDQTPRFAAIGVHTLPRFRRLGLGRAAASPLIDHIIGAHGRSPLWSASPENTASLALARSLGFSAFVTEPLWRWPDER